MNKRGFTLVELIVVITILAILGTIAFISLQGYSRDARDATRTADLGNIKISLELFSLKTGKYPSPDLYSTITYSGGTENVWYQGVVGDIVTINLKSLNEKPLDPLTNTPYTYSVTNSYKEYEVLALYEGAIAYNPIINSVNAAVSSLTPKIVGNYNGVFVRTNNYIIPTPSIVIAEPLLTGTRLSLTSTNIRSLVVTNGKNIPSNTLTPTQTGALNIKLSVYTGSITKASTSQNKLDVMRQIQGAYTGTSLSTQPIYSNVLNQTTNEQLLVLSSTVFKLSPPSLGGACGTDSGLGLTSTPTNLCAIGVSSNMVDNGQGGTYTWSCNRSNGGASTTCSANHLTVINGTCGSSAGLNLTTPPTTNLCNIGLATSVVDNGQGNTYAWSCNGSNGGTNSNCVATNTNSIYPGCNTPDIILGSYTIAACNIGSTTTSGYGSYSSFGASCSSGYHIPSKTEWENIITTNGGALSPQLPKTGSYNSLYGGRYYNRGTYGYYWTSTYNGSYGSAYIIISNGSGFLPTTYQGGSVNYYFSRCFKN